jgi:hypothetical protein
MIDSEIHNVVSMLTFEERKDCALAERAVRTQLCPLREAGSANEYGVPKAEE